MTTPEIMTDQEVSRARVVIATSNLSDDDKRAWLSLVRLAQEVPGFMERIDRRIVRFEKMSRINAILACVAWTGVIALWTGLLI